MSSLLKEKLPSTICLSHSLLYLYPKLYSQNSGNILFCLYVGIPYTSMALIVTTMHVTEVCTLA